MADRAPAADAPRTARTPPGPAAPEPGATAFSAKPQPDFFLFGSTSSNSASTTLSAWRRRRARPPPLPPPAGPPPPASPPAGCASAGLLRLVERLAHLHGRLGQRLGGRLDGVRRRRLPAPCAPRRCAASTSAFSAAGTLSPFSFSFFSVLWTSASGLVARLDLLAALLVGLGVGLGLLDHALDLGLGQAGRGLDLDLLLLAGRLVLGLDARRCRWRRCRRSTSICGTPRGAGGMPVRSNWPSSLLSAAISRSPWRTWMVTAVWLSSAVEKTWLFLVGMVVLRSISLVKTPPRVSMPSESGVTSSSSTSLTSPLSTPPWMAAPMATTSSGLTPCARLLAEELLHRLDDLGHAGHAADQDHLVDLARLSRPASFSACSAGLERALRSGRRPAPRASRGSASCTRCFGPEASAVMKGRLISVSLGRGQLALGLLGGLLQPLQRQLSLRRSMPCSLLELVGQPVDDALVEVLAAEEGVAVGGLHLEDAVADLEDRDVEGAAAEVVDRDGAGRSSCPGRRRAPPRSAR